MAPHTTIFVFSLIFSQGFSWEALPQIPSGRRSQFLVLHEDGGYKYGYDTGDGSAAKQSGDSANQVSGHYFYKNSLGQDVDLKYTAGVQGFVPEGFEKFLVAPVVTPPVQPVPAVSTYSASENEESTGDASYSFNIDTDTYKRQETSDARGNVKGSYSYNNEAGVHDLSYTAGENAGFVAISGSLARANGLKNGQSVQNYNGALSPKAYSAPAAPGVNVADVDGSYAFSYSTGDSSRQETADAGNNVQGKYSYQNEVGSHDLSYVAGSKTGFLVTGGSLSKPNGLNGSPVPSSVSAYSASPVQSAPAPVDPVSVSQPSGDGSYSFEYSAGDHSRQETADAKGNVRGRYSFTNKEGTHDLSYVAGSSTGFLPVQGSLSVPNGLAGAPVDPASAPVAYSQPVQQPSSDSAASPDDAANTGDASYSFSIDTDDYQRQESSDASGNVEGRYSYKNAAGTHDLSFVAGSQTGFLPTGGSLFNPKIAAVANQVSSASVLSKAAVPEENKDDLANTGDSSYSFSFDTDEYKRTESSDAKGNVQGSYSYKNAAGTHDLSYIAGSSTGFVATSGSLSDPNAITTKIASLPYTRQSPVVSPKVQTYSSGSEAGEQSTGDASYSFSIDTDDYKRQEVSDANGNIQGSYSYKNSVGNHDLSFTAGSATGFLPISGSLKTAPGLTEDQLRSGYSYTKSASSSVVQSPVVQSYSARSQVAPDAKVLVRSYLPPSNEKKKFGYIYDTL